VRTKNRSKMDGLDGSRNSETVQTADSRFNGLRGFLVKFGRFGQFLLDLIPQRKSASRLRVLLPTLEPVARANAMAEHLGTCLSPEKTVQTIQKSLTHFLIWQMAVDGSSKNRPKHRQNGRFWAVNPRRVISTFCR
jgi:hypothetical protein